MQRTFFDTPSDNQEAIDRLLDLLSKHTLDPTFENYGNFISSPLFFAKWCYETKKWQDDKDRLIYPDQPTTHRFNGNFYDFSGVFRIDTADQKEIEILTAAIRGNQATQKYQQVKAEIFKKQ